MNLSLENSTKLALSFVLAIAAITVVDTTIVGFIAFSNMELPTLHYLLLFVGMFVVFSLSGLILLKSANKNTTKSAKRTGIRLRSLSFTMLALQLIIIGIVFSIIFQMILSNSYQIIFIDIAVYITHFSALLFLCCLVLVLVKWVRSNKNLMVLSYAISFSLLCLYLFISCIYLTTQINSVAQERGAIRVPMSIHFSLTSPPAAALQIVFGPILDLLSLGSFVSAWIATAALLRQYRQRIGKLKYWCLIAAPLVYFLFPFGTYFIDISDELMTNSPVLFSIIYVSTFSATKQVGGLLFSMVFLTAASVINRTELKRYLVISAIGLSILFGSIGANSLLYAIYPPFGLITISFMPIGAYLLFNGIYGSARLVSVDSELRKRLHKSAESQLSLLKTIGVTQMEGELFKKFKPVLQKTEILQSNEEHLEQEDVKLLIHDVLKEIESRKKQKQSER
jgi:hypothetical protein